MSVIRLIAPALICAAVVTPVSADVTLRLKRTGACSAARPQIPRSTLRRAEGRDKVMTFR